MAAITAVPVAGYNMVFSELKGNKLITALSIVAYGVWRVTKQARKAERLEDKAERRQDKTEIQTRGLKAIAERSLDGDEAYLVMVDKFWLTTFIAVSYALSSFVYSAYPVCHESIDILLFDDSISLPGILKATTMTFYHMARIDSSRQSTCYN